MRDDDVFEGQLVEDAWLTLEQVASAVVREDRVSRRHDARPQHVATKHPCNAHRRRHRKNAMPAIKLMCNPEIATRCSVPVARSTSHCAGVMPRAWPLASATTIPAWG